MGMLDDVYSVEEVAKFLGLKPSRVYALLRKDQHTPPMERSLPGAWKEQGIYNVEWFIPASAVEHWRELRDQRADDLSSLRPWRQPSGMTRLTPKIGQQLF